VLIRGWDSGVFSEMFAFPALNLQPHFTSFFCARFLEAVYIECQSTTRVVRNILADNVRLGAHCEVWLFLMEGITRFVWFHRVAQPNGIKPLRQCEKCGALDSLHVTINKADVEWRCHAQKTSDPKSPKCGRIMRKRIPTELQNLGVSPLEQGTWKLVKM
jgi:hypothetical protein